MFTVVVRARTASASALISEKIRPQHRHEHEIVILTVLLRRMPSYALLLESQALIQRVRSFIADIIVEGDALHVQERETVLQELSEYFPRYPLSPQFLFTDVELCDIETVRVMVDRRMNMRPTAFPESLQTIV